MMQPLQQIMEILSRMPEAEAVPVAPPHRSLEVAGRRFGWYMEDHHGDGRVQINCRAPQGRAAAWAVHRPDRYHLPRHARTRGWAGIWLDVPDLDWSEIEDILWDAWRMTAPKELRAKQGPASEA